MKKTITHERYGKITYRENFFNGKQEVITDNDELVYEIVGNYAAGVSLKINGKLIEIIPKTKKYEYLIYFLPLIFVIVWGFIPKLVEILPVVGGLIGGAISGALSFVALIYGKATDKIYLKILISLAALIVSVAICAGLGFLIS